MQQLETNICHHVKAEKMHATLRKSLMPKFRKVVDEGAAYILKNVMVGYN